MRASVLLRARKTPQAVHRYLATWYLIAPILSEFSESDGNIQTAYIGHCGLLSVLLVPEMQRRMVLTLSTLRSYWELIGDEQHTMGSGEKEAQSNKEGHRTGGARGHWSVYYGRDIGEVVLKTRKAVVI